MSQIVSKFITDLAVTTAKINTSAVTDAKIASGISASKINVTGATSVTAASGDEILIADVSDSNNVKKVTAQSIADLAGAGVTFAKENFTLAGGDITNQFITLANAPIMVLSFVVKGGAPLLEGASHDYTVTGAQVDFENDLATGGAAALVATDVVQVTYVY